MTNIGTFRTRSSCRLVQAKRRIISNSPCPRRRSISVLVNLKRLYSACVKPQRSKFKWFANQHCCHVNTRSCFNRCCTHHTLPMTAVRPIRLRKRCDFRSRGTIDGTLKVTNTGNSVDVFTLSSVGLDCDIESSVLLQPGASSSELPWNCEIPSNALAGTNAFSFRSVSSARSDAIENEVVVYTVDATWDSSSVAAISIGDET